VAKRVCVLVILLAALTAGGARTLADSLEPPSDPPVYRNPVMEGDFPDPTAVRVGGEYWAIATMAPGQPSPPILRSRDLVHWSLAGHIYERAPSWSTGTDVWGPWLERNGDRYLVYYSARKKRGPWCLTIGVASNPIGPYTDSGPLVCQRGGSIDPSVVTGVDGGSYLVWKENGNGSPSTLWVQALSADGLTLTGSPRRIMVAQRNGWEHGLIEGPRIVQRHGWLYLFYSGAGCCIPKTCNYALGVARSRSIYGPWTRAKQNPILKSDKQWICPGHGALLQPPSGHWWLLYNGYRATGPPDRPRVMLLDLVHWSRDAWPYLTPGSVPRRATQP
jgi:beta-xylosidase